MGLLLLSRWTRLGALSWQISRLKELLEGLEREGERGRSLRAQLDCVNCGAFALAWVMSLISISAWLARYFCMPFIGHNSKPAHSLCLFLFLSLSAIGIINCKQAAASRITVNVKANRVSWDRGKTYMSKLKWQPFCSCRAAYWPQLLIRCYTYQVVKMIIAGKGYPGRVAL